MHAFVFAVLSVLAAPVLAETIHGLVVFTRHGDSTSIPLMGEQPRLTRMAGTPKYYQGWQMTALGEAQMFDAGSYYRSRYIEKGAPHQILGISPDKYQRSQIWSSAPDQMVRGSLPEFPADVGLMGQDPLAHRNRFSPGVVPAPGRAESGVGVLDASKRNGGDRAVERISIRLDPR